MPSSQAWTSVRRHSNTQEDTSRNNKQSTCAIGRPHGSKPKDWQLHVQALVQDSPACPPRAHARYARDSRASRTGVEASRSPPLESCGGRCCKLLLGVPLGGVCPERALPAEHGAWPARSREGGRSGEDCTRASASKHAEQHRDQTQKQPHTATTHKEAMKQATTQASRHADKQKIVSHTHTFLLLSNMMTTSRPPPPSDATPQFPKAQCASKAQGGHDTTTSNTNTEKKVSPQGPLNTYCYLIGGL